MKNVLIFLWIFIFPIANFIWELFHRNMEKLPPLTKKERHHFNVQFFTSILWLPFCGIIIFLIGFLGCTLLGLLGLLFGKPELLYETWNNVHMPEWIHISEWSLTKLTYTFSDAYVLVIYLDFVLAVMIMNFIAPSGRKKRFYTEEEICKKVEKSEKWQMSDCWFLNWKFMKECWPIYEAMLPSLWFVHGPITLIILSNMNETIRFWTVILYPIISYFHCKRIYSYCLYYQKKGLFKKLFPFEKGKSS